MLNKNLLKINATDIKIVDFNIVNKGLFFTLNSKRYSASYSEGKDVVESFCFEYDIDDSIQETSRRFFYNLKQVVEHSLS